MTLYVNYTSIKRKRKNYKTQNMGAGKKIQIYLWLLWQNEEQWYDAVPPGQIWPDLETSSDHEAAVMLCRAQSPGPRKSSTSAISKPWDHCAREAEVSTLKNEICCAKRHAGRVPAGAPSCTEAPTTEWGHLGGAWPCWPASWNDTTRVGPDWRRAGQLTEWWHKINWCHFKLCTWEYVVMLCSNK